MLQSEPQAAALERRSRRLLRCREIGSGFPEKASAGRVRVSPPIPHLPKGVRRRPSAHAPLCHIARPQAVSISFRSRRLARKIRVRMAVVGIPSRTMRSRGERAWAKSSIRTLRSPAARSSSRRTAQDDPAVANARLAYILAATARPQDPRAAVFWHVVEFLLIRLLQECRPPRWDALRNDALKQVKRLLGAASSGGRLADQNAAVQIVWSVIQRGRLDLRKERRSVGPEPLSMANEFDATHEVLSKGNQTSSRPVPPQREPDSPPATAGPNSRETLRPVSGASSATLRDWNDKQRVRPCEEHRTASRSRRNHPNS